MAVDDKVLSLIEACETGRQAWLKLEEFYEKGSTINTLLLERHVANIKYKDNENMSVHLASLEDVHKKLKATGEPQTDSRKVAIVLQSLPSSFDPLIMSLSLKTRRT